MKSAEINEKSTIPISLLIVVAGAVVSIALWLSSMFADVAQAKRDIIELNQKDKEKSHILNKLDHGLIRIQERLGIDVPNEE